MSLACYSSVNSPQTTLPPGRNVELTVASHTRNPRSVGLPRESPMSPKTHILVVEDEADIANLIKHSLERAPDFVVSVAASGDAAMRALGESLPDLMVLDLNLPVISGTDICRRVRGTARTAQLPIIMLTARTDESDRVAGLELGADDYVTKPFSLRELGARVRAVLRRRLQGEPQTPV